jgi:hypothetical protein
MARQLSIQGTRRQALRPVEITGGYCWPTPKYRNWCAQHAFFEGKKAGETSSRKSTPRTLKKVGQQYPGVIRAPGKKHGHNNATMVGAQDHLILAYSEYR